MQINYQERLPRRVAVISYHTCPLAKLGGKKTGGMNVYVRDFSRALAETGIYVDVFTRTQPGCEPPVNHELGPRCRVIHIGAGPVDLTVAAMADYLDIFTDGVLAFARQEAVTYDLIHCHYWLSGLIGERLQAEWGHPPLVQMFHTLGYMKNRIAGSPAERAPQARLDGETHLIGVANRLIAATQSEEFELQKQYGAPAEQISVIPPGVDLQRFKPLTRAVAKEMIGIPLERKNILFAGRIEPLKGVDTLLRALGILQEEHQHELGDVCVTIIGGNPWSDERDAEMRRLQIMSAELALHDLVTFAGTRDQDVLPYYYAAAEMVVMPSHYESFGMVALESMAMGTPVIASEVGGLAHLVQDGRNGYLVPPGDATALAAHILRLLRFPEIRRALGAQAQTFAADYDWPHIVARVLTVYRELTAQPSPVK